MTKAIRPTDNQNYYSSALQRAQIIEKAVSLAEQGKSVVDFKSYTDAFTTLVEKMNAKTAKGGIAPEHLQSHQELDRTLRGLGKRIEVVKSGKITPPPARPSKVSSWTSGWSFIPIAKCTPYVALGGLTIWNAPQIWQIAKQVPTAVKIAFFTFARSSEVHQTVTDISNTFIECLKVLGQLISNAREVVNDPTAPNRLTQGTSREDNIAIGINFIVHVFAFSQLANILKLVLPTALHNFVNAFTMIPLIGNTVIADFTQKSFAWIEQIFNSPKTFPYKFPEQPNTLR